MLKYFSIASISTLLLIHFPVKGQYNWIWTELDTMPVKTSNNAVCEAFVGGQEYVYSFGGIDASKSYSGIHQRSFKYDVVSGQWSEIAGLPDTLGKIASGASFVNGKIYIIGGYHVFENGTELSSDKVHIYNPQTETFEADGSPIPVPIDDHVQCVYKDSLIYVVTGWSNTTNVPAVQIYNPGMDQWLSGTDTPNTGYFKVFGASGYILGDTLYYHGGTTAGFSFTAQPFMRKGYINPQNPTEITWTLMNDAPGESGYRSACSGVGNTVFWVGGSGTSYNYDGIAYNGSGGVEPSTRILHFNQWNYVHVDNTNEPFGVMDLRGIACLSNDRWIICGGMDSSQQVGNRTFLLENDLLGLMEIEDVQLDVSYFDDRIVIRVNQPYKAILLDLRGRVISEFPKQEQFIINRSALPKGVYLFRTGTKSIKLSF